jgi:hypothetical protein
MFSNNDVSKRLDEKSLHVLPTLLYINTNETIIEEILWKNISSHPQNIAIHVLTSCSSLYSNTKLQIKYSFLIY